ncbi:MAG: OsmC family protein [Acidimicrobiales bacterium]
MPTSESTEVRHRRTVSATSSERGRFEFTNGAVRVQSSREGDRGVRAVDLLLASLAMCVAGTVRAYAENHGVEGLDVVSVEVTGEEVAAPTRLATANITIRLEGELGDEERARLLRAGAHCKIHTTLSRGVDVQFS